jgi:hypothetical protein
VVVWLRHPPETVILLRGPTGRVAGAVILAVCLALHGAFALVLTAHPWEA